MSQRRPLVPAFVGHEAAHGLQEVGSCHAGWDPTTRQAFIDRALTATPPGSSCARPGVRLRQARPPRSWGFTRPLSAGTCKLDASKQRASTPGWHPRRSRSASRQSGDLAVRHRCRSRSLPAIRPATMVRPTETHEPLIRPCHLAALATRPQVVHDLGWPDEAQLTGVLDQAIRT